MLKDLEKTLKAGGDRTRLRILKMLQPQPLCVCQIVATLGISQSTVSKHLAVLEAADLVQGERMEKWTFYRLARPQAPEPRGLLSLLRRCAAEDPQVAKDQLRVMGEKVQKMAPECVAPTGPRGRRKA